MNTLSEQPNRLDPEVEKRFDKFWPDWGAALRKHATTATEISNAEQEDRRRDLFKSFLATELARERERIGQLLEECGAWYLLPHGEYLKVQGWRRGSTGDSQVYEARAENILSLISKVAEKENEQ